MTPQDWRESYARAITMALSGATGDWSPDDDPFLVMLNAWQEPVDFAIPESLRGIGWRIEVDTSDPGVSDRAVDPEATLGCSAHSLLLLHGTPAPAGAVRAVPPARSEA